MQNLLNNASETKKRIVIIGGGFAGTTLLKKMIHSIPDEYELVLISEDSYTTFNPMLAEVVGASIFPEHVVAPIRAMYKPNPKFRFVMAKVSDIDHTKKTIICETLKAKTKIHFDQLVLAFGNRAKLDLLPGMSEFALPLKTVGDATHIRNIVLRRIAQIELETEIEVIKSLGHFAVIGGGFSGVEVAGELIDCLHDICKYYPLVNLKHIQVSILHDQKYLLSELPIALGNAAAKSLESRGVKLFLNTRATSISETSIELDCADTLFARTVITTIGTTANPLVAKLQLPVERGRIVVNPDLSIKTYDGLWALGDCALVPNAFNDQFSPPTAQFAVRQAKFLAANLLRKIAHQPTKAFYYKSLGSMAAIGHMKGVANIAGINISGMPAWLIWRAYYLLMMPTIGRKVRIYVEWTWGMFFSADITHLKFNRSADNSSK